MVELGAVYVPHLAGLCIGIMPVLAQLLGSTDGTRFWF